MFLNSKREVVNTVTSEFPLTGKDNPGFRFFSEVKKLENWSENLIALFSMKDNQAKDMYMQVLVPGKSGRTYYQAMSLKTHTSGRQYEGKPMPVFTMRDSGESKNKPFIAVFEPFRDKNAYSVDKISVEQQSDGGDFTSLSVLNKDRSHQIVLQAIDNNKTFTSGKCTLKGYLGIVGLTDEKLYYLYLGKGSEISYSGYFLRTKTSGGSANLEISVDKYLITCNQETIFEFPVKKVEKLTLSEGSRKEDIKFSEKGNSITFSLPAVKNGEIRIEF
jgi:hypothetical protein